MPAPWRMLLVLALYAAYLPLSGYTINQYRFDAAQYWELSLKFTQHGGFSLLAFDEPLRGYLGPLLILPARLLCHFTGWSMLTGARVLGACWASVLFGLAIPQLWAQVTGRALPLGRWLLLLGLTFLFWRDYFNFTLSDMPALTLLLLGLVALGRPGWRWVLLAGILLAAAINIRPIYLASAPGWLWLLGQRVETNRNLSICLTALVAGLALVLLPQALINQRNFQRPTPLVLAQPPGSQPLYLKQLAWGTQFQRYESSLIPEISRSLVYADTAGQRALADVPGQRFASYGHFATFVAQQPLSAAARFLRHLFNGLDIWFSTPYPTRLHPTGQAALRLINYVLLGLAVALIVAGWRYPRRQQSGAASRWPQVAPVLLALLLPCALALPTLIECRFLLPLHLLILAGVAGYWQPVTDWQRLRSPLRRLAVLGLALGWLWGCWQLSAATAGQLRPPSEAPES